MAPSGIQAATIAWDGAGVSGTDLGTAANWAGDVLPSPAVPDTAQWNGSVAGALALGYSNALLAGAAGNAGINLDITAAQTSSLSMDSGANTSSIRLNGLTIAAGAGAVSFGDGVDTFNLTLGGAAGTHTWTNESSNVATLNSDVVFGLGGAGAHVLALGGAGNWQLNNNITPLSGTLTIAKNGAGTATIAGTIPAATAVISGFQINAGILDLAKDVPLSGGTIASGTGGTINATGGGKILLNVAGGDLGVSNGGTLTVNSIIANGTQTAIDFWNTASGTGVVVLTADNTFSGTTNLQSGIISVGKIANSGVAGNIGTNGTLNFGATTSVSTLRYTGSGETNDRVINLAGTTGGAILEQSGAGLLKFTSSLTATGLGNKTVSLLGSTAGTGELAGAIVNSAGFATSVFKNGTSAWTLSGANTYTGSTAVRQGTLNLSGSAKTGVSSILSVVDNNAASTFSAKVNISSNYTAVQSFVGDRAGAGQLGAIYQTSGTVVFTQAAGIDNLRVGSTTGGNGYYKISGGSVTANRPAIGASLADTVGVVEVSGGLFAANEQLHVAAGSASSSGLLNVTEGSATAGTDLRMLSLQAGTGGATSQGVVNVGGGITTASITTGNSAAQGLNLAQANNVAGALGVANILTNGTFNTGRILGTQTGATTHLNFNGGTLKATAINASTTFLTDVNLDAVNVYSGGGTVDNNNTLITIGKGLLAPATFGVSGSSIVVPSGGSGYVGAPLVKFTGGTGTGATGYAVVSGGVVTNIVVTSPGIGYTSGDILTASFFGGGATTAATNVTGIPVAANVSGGMAFLGGGTTTLSGISTYTGTTAVSAGTLALTGTLGASPVSITGGTFSNSLGGDPNSSPGITVNGSGAKLLQTGFTPISTPVTLTNGTLDGTSTLNSVTVGNATGGVITNGNGTTGALTIDTLTFTGAATVNLNTNSTSPVLLTNTLTTNAAGVVTVNATNPSWVNGQTYQLISYGSLSGAGFSKFSKGTISGLGARQTASLANVGGAVSLSITGDLPVWSGALNGDWTTTVLSSPKNWKSQNLGTGTDFITNDAVLFSDAATGTTSVNISTANVATSSISFTNSTAKPYTISSTGGFGITSGLVLKSGDGTVTLNTPNTYAGGTIIEDGRLNINNASAIGTGLFTLNGFGNTSIDNTSGAPVTLTTNNAQVWNTDVTFGGSNSLNLGTGNVTIANNQLITTNGSATLTIGGNISSGSYSLTKEGTGTLALGGANGYTSATYFNAGGLNINGPSAIGTGTLIIGGATLDNTSAGAVALVTNNAQNWDSDFTFTGTQSLGFGTGAATLGGDRVITVTANTLATGMLNTSAFALTKAGAGTLAFGNGGTSTVGALNVSAGTLQIGINDFTTTSLTGSGVVENGSATTRWFFVNGTTDTTFSGILRDGAGAGRLGFAKYGSSTLTLTGNNTYSDVTTVGGGTLVYNGTTNNVSGVDVVGNTAGTTAKLVLSPGSSFGANFNSGQLYNSSMNVGVNATSAGSIRVNDSTTTFNVAKQLALGTVGYGAFSQSFGTTTIGGYLAVGNTVNGGVINQSGGSVTLTSAAATFGYGGGSAGLLNLSGNAVFNANAPAGLGVWIGENGSAVLNVSDNAVISVPNDGLILGKANTTLSTGVANLNGGTASVTAVSKGTGTGILNLNSGVLKANVANANFLTGLTNAYVRGGGAIINSNGFAITIAQNLEAPAGDGVTASGLTVSGTGYVDTPIVAISGGGGTGATAVAIVDNSGNLTGITITSPGVNYTSSPTFTLLGGGGTGSITGSAALTPNASGGLTKFGGGALTLGGTNTYTGVTTVGDSATTDNSSLIVTNSSALGGTAGGTIVNGEVLGTVGTLLRLGNGVSIPAGETLILATNGATQRSSMSVGGATDVAVWGGNIILSGSGRAQLYADGTAGGSLTVNGNITGSAGNGFALRGSAVTTANGIINGTINIGSTNFLKTDNSTWTINSSGNTFGDTNLAVGKLVLGANNALAVTTNMSIGQAGATTILDLNGKSQTIASVVDVTSAVPPSITSATPALLTINNSTTDTYGANGGVISGAVTLAKTGAGTLSLSGAQTYAGDTVVSAGALSINTAYLANAADVKLVTGTTLDLDFAGTDVIDELYINGVAQATGTWGKPGSGANHESPLITGTGLLSVTTGASGYGSWATTNAGGQAANLDYDNDGVSNGVEYFMGATGSSFTASPGLVNGKVTWPKDPAFNGTYSVQTSPDLINWSDVTSSVVGNTVEYTPSTGLGKVFVRLQVTPN